MTDLSSVKDDRDKFDKYTPLNALIESDDKFVIFERWLLENGTKMPKLELRDYGNEVRGCHSKEEIVEDEIIIEVPLKCLITVEMGKDTDIGRAILESSLELDAPKHIFLMLYMLIDRKRPDSFFKPYYDILPSTLSNMPIFWTADELKALDGSYMLEQIEERKVAITADYTAICILCPTFAQIATVEEFMWARMCVCSRNFGLIVNGLQTAALVPYADMLNHYRPRETKWQFDDGLQSFTVVSILSIMSGAQVYDSYGRKCNHRFLLNYGFSVENNVEQDGYCPNETPVFVELHKDDPLYELKCTYYRRDLSTPNRRIRLSVCDNDNFKFFMAFLRIMEADNKDFEILVATSNGSFYRSLRDAMIAINLQNEMRALQRIHTLCEEHLSKYPTSFAEDTERLTHGNIPLFSNERNALIQVKGEKEVLIFYQEFASTGISLLQSKDMTEFDTKLSMIRMNQHSMVFHYCRSALARVYADEYRRGELRRQQVDLSRPTVV